MNFWKWLTNVTEGPQPARMVHVPASVAQEPELPPLAAKVTVEARREAIPVFSRTYSARLDDRAHAEITMRTSSYFGRSGHGMLTQPGGKYVSFDPQAIAARILDPALVPLVEAFADHVFALDRQFMAEHGAEFIDEKGHVWRRLDRA